MCCVVDSSSSSFCPVPQMLGAASFPVTPRSCTYVLAWGISCVLPHFLRSLDRETELLQGCFPLRHTPHLPMASGQSGCALMVGLSPWDKAVAPGSELRLRWSAVWPAFPQEMHSRWELDHVNYTEWMCV